MIVANGSTDVTTYFVLRDSTNHAPKTDVGITDIDLYYLEQGAAMAAKVDATALDAADSAHADNKGYHTGQGLYRIDWPDTCFDGGVGKRVYLIVVCTGVDTTFLEVELSPNVNTASLTANVITEAAIADNAFANEHFAAGALTSAEITSAAGCAVASIAANAITATAIQNGAIDAATFAANAITSTVLADDCITAAKLNTDAIAADAFAQTAADKVWGTAARVLTAGTNLGGLEVDLTKIHGTALTETAGQLAASFSKMYDVATPVLTCESVNQEQDNATTAEIKSAIEAGGSSIAGIKAKTDSLTFTVANQVDANIQYINDTAVTGDGDATPWGPA